MSGHRRLGQGGHRLDPSVGGSLLLSCSSLVLGSWGSRICFIVPRGWAMRYRFGHATTLCLCFFGGPSILDLLSFGRSIGWPAEFSLLRVINSSQSRTSPTNLGPVDLGGTPHHHIDRDEIVKWAPGVVKEP